MQSPFYIRITLMYLLALISSISQAQELSSKVDEYMEAQIKANQFSGSVLIAQQGKVLVSKGYGMANKEEKIANTPATVFRLGSITKQFTATAIMQLQEKGKLNVQDPVCKYVDNCPAAWQPITIHHLLTHTSGIVNYTSSPKHKQLMGQPVNVMNLIGLFKNEPLEFAPGEQFKYSNSGYILLGHIIEKVSGTTYEAYVKENIANKIALKHTGYEHEKDGVPNRAVGYATNENKVEKALPIHMSYPYAAGALYSTVEDLYLWDQALYGEKILSAKSLEQMWTPFKQTYGYGWIINEAFGKKQLFHGGGINGFATSIMRFPQEKAVVIVLSNLENTNAYKIGSDLTAILFNQKYEKPILRTIASVDSKTYASYTGEYELYPGFIITVTKENEKLMAQATGQPKFEIYPETETKFFYKVVDAQISFMKNEKSEVSHLILYQNGQEITGKKIK